MAITFTAVSSQQVAYVSPAAGLSESGQSASGCAWVYTHIAGVPQTVFSLPGLSGGDALTFGTNAAGSLVVTRGAEAGFPLRRVSGVHALGGGVSFRDRGWHHVAFTYAGGRVSSDVRLFIDGVEVTSTSDQSSNDGTMKAGNGSIVVGASSLGERFDGSIRDAGLWLDRLLTPGEIAQLARREIAPADLGFGTVWAPSFAADTVDPISGVVGVRSGSHQSLPAIQQTFTPAVLNGLIAAYDAGAGATLGFGGAVTTWRDTSGGDNSATQSNTGLAPRILTATPNTMPAMSFAPNAPSPNNFQSVTVTSANAELSPDRFTVIYVGGVRLPTGTGSGANGRFAQTILGTPGFSIRVGQPASDTLGGGNMAYFDGANSGGVFPSNLRAASGPSFMAWRAISDTTISMTRLGVTAVATRAPASPAPSASWRLGASMTGTPDGYLGNCDLMLLYHRDLSDAELTRVRDQLAGTYAFAVDPRRVVVVEGSSSAAAFNSTKNQDMLWRSRGIKNDLVFNFARGGDDVSSSGPFDIRLQASASVDRVVIPGKPNLLIVQVGSNDLVNSAPSGTGNPPATDASVVQFVYGRLVQYCNARRAAGFTRIAVVTLLSRDATGSRLTQDVFETRRRMYNDLIRAGVGVAYERVIDTASDPVLGVDRAYLNSGVYSSDRIHLNDTGLTIVQGYVDRFLAGPKPRVPLAQPVAR